MKGSSTPLSRATKEDTVLDYSGAFLLLLSGCFHAIVSHRWVRVTNVPLSGRELRDLEFLLKYPVLQKLSVSHNLLQSIENIPAFVVKLNISYNHLQHTAGLEHLTQLRSLNLSHNELVSLSKFERLRKLEQLDISHNRLDSLDALNRCTSLVLLNASHNEFGIANAGHLPSCGWLTRLRVLLLSHNRLKTLSDAANRLPSSLRVLALAQNTIVSGGIADLQALGELEELLLGENPLAAHVTAQQLHATFSQLKRTDVLQQVQVQVQSPPAATGSSLGLEQHPAFQALLQQVARLQRQDDFQQLQRRKREQQAALTLQAWWRGTLIRRNYPSLSGWMPARQAKRDTARRRLAPYRDPAVPALEAAVRLLWAEVKGMRTRECDHAARIIQRAWRQYDAKMLLHLARERKKRRERPRQAAAVVIQRHVRGMLVRQALAQQQQHAQAALQIQRLWRGVCARQRVDAIRREKQRFQLLADDVASLRFQVEDLSAIVLHWSDHPHGKLSPSPSP
mgnify:CR=1 FL=1